MPENRPSFPKRAVITGGMPYGNKNLHFGHIGGVFVPADFFARFLRDRIGPENVLFVSGTDCYGSPIAEGFRKKVENEGYTGTIEDYVRANHDAQKAALDAYGISLDLFAGSGLEPARNVHARLTDELIRRLHERGYLHRRTTRQFYDVEAGTFLNGRQVQGRCPVRGCKSEKAYADECDLGHQFDPEELIAPVSQLTGTTPELRPVDNWYFDLPAFREELERLMDEWDVDPQVRAVVTKTVRESLVDPVIYVQTKFREAYDAVADKLPEHTLTEAEKGQQSFSLTFSGWEARDDAREVLDAAGVRFRTGKCLLPLRITGNIEWGVPAPELEGSSGLTVWVWPESLWAPISFTQTALGLAEEGRYSSRDWHDWWCSEDARVYQFIGQDNIYFYCVAQPALWEALGWGLTQDVPVANYHILFMNKKASSSGKIAPPMAAELLEHYTPEQLRAHWLSLGLDQKAVSREVKVHFLGGASAVCTFHLYHIYRLDSVPAQHVHIIYPPCGIVRCIERIQNRLRQHIERDIRFGHLPLIACIEPCTVIHHRRTGRTDFSTLVHRCRKLCHIITVFLRPLHILGIRIQVHQSSLQFWNILP